MFGKKQELTKELEEQLNITRFELENAQEQMNHVQNYTADAASF